MDQRIVHDRPMKVYEFIYILEGRIDREMVASIAKKQVILLNNVQ